MAESGKTEAIMIRVTPEAKAAAERIAADNNMSLSSFIRLLLRFGLRYIDTRTEEKLFEEVGYKKEENYATPAKGG